MRVGDYFPAEQGKWRPSGDWFADACLWEAHRLQPHRIRTFKRSNDPAFAEKVEDIVGLYMHSPARAIVLSIDEKSQIQPLDDPRLREGWRGGNRGSTG